jgi:hypothetical protein
MRTVPIKPGMMLIGRYDFAHGGASFDRVNVRVHFFLDPTRSEIRWRNLDTVYFGNGNISVQWLNYVSYFAARIANAAKTREKQSEKKERLRIAAASARGELLKDCYLLQQFTTGCCSCYSQSFFLL